MVGDRDTAPAKSAIPFLEETIPLARGHVVPEVGHQWNAESPEIFTDVVRAWVDSGTVDDRLPPHREVT